MASKEILEEIRARVPIVSFIGERIPLKKSGRNFKGLCPFHQEKSPSFMVSDDKQIFHCFGCGTGGDVFTFVMKIDGLDFQEALKDLAKRAGVTLPTQSGESSAADAEWERRKKWSVRINEIAQEHFVKNLQDPVIGKKALNYLKARGIDLKTAQTHQLGFAQDSWDALTNAFSAANAPIKMAEELGLVRTKENRASHYDFFRDRLMFPIFDVKGAVVGFSGRTLNAEEGAKYINSSDSLLYNKSKTLFGLFWSKDAIRTQDEAIMVEGNLDLISLRQAGVENVVAPLGTALTLDHLKLLSRYTHNFIIAFDGDKAGAMAAIRALPLFVELKLVPKAITLPEGSDPDTFIQKEGIQKWEHLKKYSKTLFEYFVDRTIAETPSGTQGVVAAWEKIKPIFEKVTNPVEAGIYKRQIAEKLRVDEKWLEGKTQKNRVTPTPDKKVPSQLMHYPREERLLIAALILNPQLIEIVVDSGDIFTDPELKNIATQLFSRKAEEKSVSPADMQTLLNDDLAGWIREMALVEEEEPTAWARAVEDCLAKIREKSFGVRLGRLNHEIAQAETEGNESGILKLLNEKTKLMEIKKRSSP